MKFLLLISLFFITIRAQNSQFYFPYSRPKEPALSLTSEMPSHSPPAQDLQLENTKAPEKNPLSSLEMELKSYLAEKQEKQVNTKTSLPYAWQTNINYIEPFYLRSFVQKLVSVKPIAEWPYVIRLLVFPQIYGFSSLEVLKPQLNRLYHDFLKEKGGPSPKEKGSEKVEILERLMKLEEVKKQIERGLIEQTEQLLEGRRFDERIDKLTEYLQGQIAKISKVDEMLQEVSK